VAEKKLTRERIAVLDGKVNVKEFLDKYSQFMGTLVRADHLNVSRIEYFIEETADGPTIVVMTSRVLNQDIVKYMATLTIGFIGGWIGHKSVK
jgi:hypothetical protein